MKQQSDYEMIVRGYLRARRIQAKATDAVHALEPSVASADVVVLASGMRRRLRPPVHARSGFFGRLEMADEYFGRGELASARGMLWSARAYREAGMVRLP